MELTWIDISKESLKQNVNAFKHLLPKETVLAVAVKGNAYGHGIIECSKVFVESGVDYLCVNSLWEAEKLRKANIKGPIMVIGYIPLNKIEKAIELNCEFVLYNEETLAALIKLKKQVVVHLKIETGNHRQGIYPEDLKNFIPKLKKNKFIEVKGVSTHFANIEDRINHAYALEQVETFKRAIKILEENGIQPKYKHCANTAASLLLPEAYFNFVRVGIGAYGMWPSDKTKRAAQKNEIKIELKPALSWKTKVAHLKKVKKGALIGYGCTYKMPYEGSIAVLPIGYYEGYSRALSNKGYVMIKNEKAPVIGRVCMNMLMIDVSHIRDIKLEDEVTLIGPGVRAEDLAKVSGTINYEVTTRIHEEITRRLV